MSKETDVILTEIKGVDTDFTGYFWHFYNNITLNLYDQTIKSVNWYDQTNKSAAHTKKFNSIAFLPIIIFSDFFFGNTPGCNFPSECY
jgi:hypothetical protein